MSGRDHSEECPVCGVWCGGLSDSPCACTEADRRRWENLRDCEHCDGTGYVPVNQVPADVLTDAECDNFRRLPVSFNDMVRAIYLAGWERVRK